MENHPSRFTISMYLMHLLKLYSAHPLDFTFYLMPLSPPLCPGSLTIHAPRPLRTHAFPRFLSQNPGNNTLAEDNILLRGSTSANHHCASSRALNSFDTLTSAYDNHVASYPYTQSAPDRFASHLSDSPSLVNVNQDHFYFSALSYQTDPGSSRHIPINPDRQSCIGPDSAFDHRHPYPSPGREFTTLNHSHPFHFDCTSPSHSENSPSRALNSFDTLTSAYDNHAASYPYTKSAPDRLASHLSDSPSLVNVNQDRFYFSALSYQTDPGSSRHTPINPDRQSCIGPDSAFDHRHPYPSPGREPTNLNHSHPFHFDCSPSHSQNSPSYPTIHTTTHRGASISLHEIRQHHHLYSTSHNHSGKQDPAEIPHRRREFEPFGGDGLDRSIKPNSSDGLVGSLQESRSQESSTEDPDPFPFRTGTTASALPLAPYGANPNPGSPNASDKKTYSFVALPKPKVVRKRPRRRYDEIDRLYECSWQDCTKAYGTLNHLNTHVKMQKHGSKRSPNEFKELRKKLRKAKEDAESSSSMSWSGLQYHGGTHNYNHSSQQAGAGL